MSIAHKLGVSALAMIIGFGAGLTITPSFASKDRVEHEDRQDRSDHGKSADRASHDKNDKNDDSGDKGDR